MSGMLPISPGNSRSNSPGRSTGESNGMSKLNITKQPPPYAFVDEWFDVEINLEASSENFGLDAVELQAGLHGYGANRLCCPEPILSGEARVVVDGPGGSIRIPLKPSGGSQRSVTKVRCKIYAAAVVDGRLTGQTQFCLSFVSPKDGRNKALPTIRPVFTTPIIMVTAKLKIRKEEWESVWYKDEGGRDKCITVPVVLCDKDDTPICNRRVPLKVTLLYDNGESLSTMKQREILRVFGPRKQIIDPKTGTATIRFRIEDVSRNHQGAAFKLEVAPDTSEFANVVPICTPPVSVKSKLNKRLRDRLPPSTPLPPDSRQARSRAPRLGAVASSMSPPGSPIRSSHSGDQTQAGLSGVSDVVRLRQAMKGVIQWTGEIVDGLHPLKWEVIGYAHFPDGTVDYSRPYYSMPNPNDCISRVLSLYSDETREHLKVLLTAVENTHPEGPCGDSEEGHRGLGPQTPAQQIATMQQSQGQMTNQSTAPLHYAAAGTTSTLGPYGVMPGQGLWHQGMHTDQGTPFNGRVGGLSPIGTPHLLGTSHIPRGWGLPR